MASPVAVRPILTQVMPSPVIFDALEGHEERVEWPVSAELAEVDLVRAVRVLNLRPDHRLHHVAVDGPEAGCEVLVLHRPALRTVREHLRLAVAKRARRDMRLSGARYIG